MDIPVLKVEKRTDEMLGKGPARRYRMRGLVPANCYGHQQQALSLVVDPLALKQILVGPRGLNTLIRLDGGEDRTVFVQEIQRDPVTRAVLHVDFLHVDPSLPIQREVPIQFEGKPVGVRLQGGLVQISRRSLLVEARPAELPEHIHLDINEMDIGDVVHVAELKTPPGVKAIYEHNFTIIAVLAPVVEEAPKEAEGEAVEGAEAAGAEGAAAGAEAKPGEAKPGEKGAKPGEKKDEGAKKPDKK
jgi:large subunit ribosomal protein L25